MGKHERFKILFKKFIDGSRWLDRHASDGIATDDDKREFSECVVAPIRDLWRTFTDDEKDYWRKVKYAVELFNADIVLDKPKRKGQRKWKRYFR